MVYSHFKLTLRRPSLLHKHSRAFEIAPGCHLFQELLTCVLDIIIQQWWIYMENFGHIYTSQASLESWNILATSRLHRHLFKVETFTILLELGSIILCHIHYLVYILISLSPVWLGKTFWRNILILWGPLYIHFLYGCLLHLLYSKEWSLECYDL
jgi:hypothetical protein